MAKIYDHAVIYNGEFYPAKTPIKEKTVVAKPETPKNPTKRAVNKSDSAAD